VITSKSKTGASFDMIDFSDVRFSVVQDSEKHYRISVLTDYYRPSESKISCEGTPGGQQVSASMTKQLRRYRARLMNIRELDLKERKKPQALRVQLS
jgi:hypothetical protein